MLDNTNGYTELTLDWDSAFEAPNVWSEPQTKSAADALVASLLKYGRVDMKYITDVTDKRIEEVTEALKGSVYQNPVTWMGDPYRGWETADGYLSGNIRVKLREARKANRYCDGRFADNVRALKELLPEAVDARDIYVTIGSPWVPVRVIEDFVSHIFKMWNRITVKHDELTGSWEIMNKSVYSYSYNVASSSTYGTPRKSALEILEDTLNMRTVAVYDEKTEPITGRKKRVINHSESVIALEKQKKLVNEFKSWVWSDPKRKKLLEDIYDERFASVRRRTFDGSFLTFPGMSKSIELYPYQRNAVARILFSPNTLLAHDVGSGKTYVMIAAGMELKRMGLSRKKLYVVPNNIVSQWKDFFKKAYPEAKVLTVDPKSFAPEKRNATLKAVRDGDHDAVIMAYSCFSRIPISVSFLLDELAEKKDAIRAVERDHQKVTAAVRRKREALRKEIEKVSKAIVRCEDGLCFDELGITALFVDEAHNFKNVPIETSVTRVLGITAGGSARCKDMMNKVRYIQKKNNGGGVVMATGTPITNSLTDAFIMQQYLQSGELALLDLNTFDSWIGMFAEKVTEFEVDVDTSGYRLATRFSRFHNLPELTAMLSSFADFHQSDDNAALPRFDGYEDILIKRSDAFAKYLKSISERAERVRAGIVDRRNDNMLKITTDGRKAALDLRLVERVSLFNKGLKVAQCAENVYRIYKDTEVDGCAQLVFCDISTPKAGFNIYDELKDRLVRMGVCEDEIAFVHDATTDTQRSRLFEGVRRGSVRVLIGSTFKLGMGVNVQERLVAVHHLDVPWRPADMTQREGRIIRQGNMCERVYVYRYITEGSFDAYSWQLLETKQRFISELLAGSLSERYGSDVDETVLSYAEVKALAIGNPLVKTRVETANELSRLSSLQHKAIEAHIRLEKDLTAMPERVARQRELCDRCVEDVRHFRASRRALDKEERKAVRQRLYDAISEHMTDPAEERTAMTYQGFDILLPQNMPEHKPFVWLCHSGRYYVEVSLSDTGSLIRIDNFLDKLSDHHKKLREGLDQLLARQKAMTDELNKKDDYVERIAELRRKVEEIDKTLGVV